MWLWNVESVGQGEAEKFFAVVGMAGSLYREAEWAAGEHG